MKIATVAVARLVATAQYENLRIELTAEVGEGEDAGFVSSQLNTEIGAMFRREFERRYPTASERQFHDWNI